MVTNNENLDSEGKPRHTLPVAKPPAGSYGNNRLIVYSPTLKRRLVLSSLLEGDDWVRIERARKKHFCEQPRRVEVSMPTGVVRTVFDFWIHHEDNTEEYREVKFSRDVLNNPRAIRQIEAQRTWCGLHGFKHVVATELTIRANPLELENWKMILHYLAMTSSIDLLSITKKVMRLLTSVRRITIAALEKAFDLIDGMLVRAAVFTLLHRHWAKAPLDTQRLTRSTTVEVDHE
jgi:hypothetical protein